MNGAQYLAYPPVVAGGPRANTIHYITNDKMIHDGQMVLMDAGTLAILCYCCLNTGDRNYLDVLLLSVGCQYYGYNSDLTRCWPVNGRFSPAQKEAYEAVLDVQSELIQLCHELPTLDALFQQMCKILGRNLSELGFGRSSAFGNKFSDQSAQVFDRCCCYCCCVFLVIVC